jgi:type II secretory pathway pseudopilin PulG
VKTVTQFVRFSASEDGFSLVEFLASTLILLVISAYAFSVMADMEREANYQHEVQAVLANVRIATETVQRYLRHAGNNPRGIALQAVTIVNSGEVQLQADLTGSSAMDPNRGDPDGDINDLDENVTLRYNPNTRTIEVVLADGTVRSAAGFITNFTMQYLDETGAATTIGNDVRRIQVTLSGASQLVHLKTRQAFATTETFNVQLISR